ncbi:uncharacterized protein LOC129583140 isoform X2 [Paramacrobiotus metropolitanus]|uniref:uncharacterized protein LOC129583140 isoform X2 n=1 Tax=Paramacrobiotus metropolitanus TaxID=2943436 RepID=UPI00244567F7|nr:uncharacterized protein LOC129583140 isoform X2 [Paramacrobiotus metropolitanus]
MNNQLMERDRPWLMPAVRATVPSPFFICQQLYRFFTHGYCTDLYPSHNVFPKVSYQSSISGSEEDSESIESVADSDNESISDLEESPTITHISIPSNPYLKISEAFAESSAARSSSYTEKTSSVEVFEERSSFRSEGSVLFAKEASASLSFSSFRSGVSGQQRCDIHGDYHRISSASSEVKSVQSGSQYVDSSVGPCPCFVSYSDPNGLRKFRPPNVDAYNVNTAESSDVRRLYSDYGLLTKQNTSLRDEVDRLEASLSVMEESRSVSRNSSKEIRVVLYGDMGSALADQLPTDNLSEGLYTMNVNLLKKLETEKKKVEKRNEEVFAMSTHLQSLITTVDSFQSRFEEHLSEVRSGLANKTYLSLSGTSDRSGRTESGFGDGVSVDPYLPDESGISHEESSVTGRANIHSISTPDRQYAASTEWKLASELKNIVTDLHKVVGDISVHESRWSDEQKSWVLFSGDLSCRLSALLKLVSELNSSYTSHRSNWQEGFAQLKGDIADSLERLRGLTGLLLKSRESVSEREHLDPINTRKRHMDFGIQTAFEESENRVIPKKENDVFTKQASQYQAEDANNDEFLEQRYQSAVKRLHNSGQEKFLLESTIEKLKDELELGQIERESLLKKNERTLMSLNAVLSEKNAVETALNTVSADLEATANIRWTLESTSALLKQTVSGLEKEKDALMVSIARFADEKVLLQKTIDDQSDRINILTKEFSNLKSDSELLSQELRSMTGQADKLVLVKEELVQITAQMEELQNQISRLTVERENLLSLVPDLEAANTHSLALQKSLEEKDVLLEKLGNALADEQQTTVLLREKLQAAEVSLTSQADQITDLEKSISLLQCTVRELEKEQSAVTAERDQGTERCAQLDQQIALLRDELSGKSDQMSLLQSNAHEQSDYITTLHGKVQSMETLLQELTQANDAIQQLKSDLEESLRLNGLTLDEKSARIEQLEREVEEKIAWIRENQREIDLLGSDLANSTAESDQLREDLRRQAEQLRDTIGRIDGLKVELVAAEEASQNARQLQEDYGVLSQRFSELKKQNQALEAEIDRLNADVLDGSNKLTKDEAELARLHSEVAHLHSLMTLNDQRYNDLHHAHELLKDDSEKTLRDKVGLESDLGIYSDIVRLLVGSSSPFQVIFGGGTLWNPDAMGDHTRLSIPIFTPDGVIYGPDEEQAVDDERFRRVNGSPLDENDSGFVGSGSQASGDVHSVDEKASDLAHTVTELNDLLLRIERHDDPSVLRTHTASLIKDIHNVESFVKDLEHSRVAAAALQRTITHLSRDLASHRLTRDRLTDERDGLRDQVDNFISEVRSLKKCLDFLEKDKQTYQDDLASKETTTVELKTLLQKAEEEIDILKRSYATASSTIRQLNNSNSSVLSDKENEIATVRNELTASQMAAEELRKQNSRNEERIKDVLTKLTETDGIVAELSSQLREAENKLGQADHLELKAEALQKLEDALDARIIQIQEREEAVRRLEQQVACFVTDQLALTNREAEVNDKAYMLAMKEASLKDKETELQQQCNSVRQIEDRFAQRESEILCQASERERLAVDRFSTERRLVTDDMEGRIHRYQCQLDDLTKTYNDVNDQASRFKSDAESLRCENRELKDRITRTSNQTVPRDIHECEVKELRDSLTDKAARLSAVCTDNERLQLAVRDSETKLRNMKKTCDDLEGRLQNKAQGQGSAEDRFAKLNTMYTDILSKYRTLSEAYDEREIQIVRNKDEYRDAKRELDNLLFMVRRHLGDSACAVPSRAAKETLDEKVFPAVTKDMLCELRVNVEQLLEDRNRQSRQLDSISCSQNGPSISGNQLLSPSSERKSRYSRSSPRSNDADINAFREQVISRLYEDTSRRSITLEEMMMDGKTSPTVGLPDGERKSSASGKKKRSADPLRRQALN